MNLSVMAAGILALAAAATVGSPSLSSAVFAPESRFTTLGPDACAAVTGSTRSAGDGEGARVCPGLGGARVLVSSRSGRTSLGFAWSSRRHREGVVQEAGFDPAIEWRGLAGARGFEPFAILVQVSQDAERGGVAGHTRILVLRVRAEEACLVGTVAAATAAIAQESARRLADAHARTSACGPDGQRDGDAA